MFEFRGSIISPLCSILDIKKIFLSQGQNDVCWHNMVLIFHRFITGICKFIFRQMFKQGSFIFCKMVNTKIVLYRAF